MAISVRQNGGIRECEATSAKPLAPNALSRHVTARRAHKSMSCSFSYEAINTAVFLRLWLSNKVI
jgi:hypothetical protein